MDQAKAYQVTISERRPDGSLKLLSEHDADALVLACAQDEENRAWSWNVKGTAGNAEKLVESMLCAFFDAITNKMEEIHNQGGHIGTIFAMRFWTVIQRAAHSVGLTIDVSDDEADDIDEDAP